MSTDPRLTDVSLPGELVDVENSLQRLSPRQSAVSRDALMYQAGWSAAMAQASGKTHWLWPTSTAALAATLIFALAHPLASPLQRAGTEPGGIASAPPPPQQTSPSTPAAAQPVHFPRKFYSPRAPLLTLREQALRLEFNDYVGQGVAEDGPPEISTNRSLLQEFLPEDSSIQRGRPWWSLSQPGGSA